MIKLNGTVLNFSRFPNGETKMDETQLNQELGQYNNVYLSYEDDSDLIKLMFTKFFLDRKGVFSQLSIAYMPYSRMDRSVDGSAFTLKYVTDFINALKFDRVWVFEPHSDVTTALINNCEVIYPSIELLEIAKKQIDFNENHDVIYFPDSGAEKRYGSMVKAKNVVVGMKHRDFETGKITKLTTNGASIVPFTPFKVIIIDDLCSYGGTFMLGGQAMKDLGASRIYLVVAHCENSIFYGDVLSTNVINKVFTTDSIHRPDELPVFDILISSYKLGLYGKLTGALKGE